MRDRDRLREHLSRARIGTGIHYPAPVHLQPAYRGRLAEFPCRSARNDARRAAES